MPTDSHFVIESAYSYTQTIRVAFDAVLWSFWNIKEKDQPDFLVSANREALPTRKQNYKYMALSAVNTGIKFAMLNMARANRQQIDHNAFMNSAVIRDRKGGEMLTYSVKIRVEQSDPVKVRLDWSATPRGGFGGDHAYGDVSIYDLDHHVVDALAAKLEKKLTR